MNNHQQQYGARVSVDVMLTVTVAGLVTMISGTLAPGRLFVHSALLSAHTTVTSPEGNK